MTLTTETYMPERKYVPFTTTLRTSEITSAASSGTPIVTGLPLHNIDWIELNFVCTTYDVDITFTLDSTAITPASGTIAMTASTGTYYYILAVKGVPVTTDLSFGSHALTLKAVTHSGSNHGKINGYIILHGHRLE
jgi:hypothetical protein